MSVKIVEYDLTAWDAVRTLTLDTWTAQCIQEYLTTGKSKWVTDLYVCYGERLVRLVDVLRLEPVEAPVRWVRRVCRDLQSMIQSLT